MLRIKTGTEQPISVEPEMWPYPPKSLMQHGTIKIFNNLLTNLHFFWHRMDINEVMHEFLFFNAAIHDI